jgi:hypothetical protein
MENSKDNEYSPAFVDGVIRDYMAWKKKNTNNPDADNANSKQRVLRIPAGNPGAAPANNNQRVAGQEVIGAGNPGSSSVDINRQQSPTQDIMIGKGQKVIPANGYINMSKQKDSAGLSNKYNDGHWEGGGARKINNIMCESHWLRVSPSGSLWSGNWRGLPVTYGANINGGGNPESGDGCLSCDPDGKGHIVPFEKN